MNTQSNHLATDAAAEPTDTPEWLVTALQFMADYQSFAQAARAAVPPQIQQRCQAAASYARALAQARRQHARQLTQFAPRPLPDYLAGLFPKAETAQPVLAWLGLTAFAPLTEATVRPLAELAHDIGLSLRETWLRVRIGCLQQEGLQPLLVRHRAHGFQQPSLEAYEALLAELERGCDPATWQQCQRLEQLVRAVYAQGQ